jgi:hypothetical protein
MASGGGKKRVGGRSLLATVALAALGLVPWAAAQFVALLLGAGGHGWDMPFLLSMPLLFLYPLVLVRALRPSGSGAGLELGAGAVAVLLDLLMLGSLSDEAEYVRKIVEFGGAPYIAGWLILWAGWQGLLVLAAIRNRRAGGD